MIKSIKVKFSRPALLLIFFALLCCLVACGGSKDSDTTPIPTTPTADSISLSASPASINSDGSTTSTITVNALNSSNAMLSGITVTLSTDTGVLSAASVVTDSTTPATVILSYGGNQTNRTVTITATAGTVSTQIPIQIVGSTVTLASSASSIPNDNATTITLTATAKDAGNHIVPGAAVTLTQSGVGSVTITNATGTTDSSGTFTTTVTGAITGAVTITATALGTTATTALTVTATGASFGIENQYLDGSATPITGNPDPTAMSINSTSPPGPYSPHSLKILVNAPGVTAVRFATTIGGWNSTTNKVLDVTVGASGDGPNKASATLTSTNIGIANVQVSDTAHPEVSSDTLTVTMASGAPPAKIMLQASPTIVPVSVGSTTGSSTLTATVYDASNNPLPNWMVAFSIVAGTSGGETITPVVAPTTALTSGDLSIGQARVSFTSGSQPSGGSGVQIRASVIGSPTVVETEAVGVNLTASGNDAAIVIGGVAGSIAFGQATSISDDSTSANYIWKMSVLVSDSNGNAVPRALISLGVRPIAWSTGPACTVDADGATKGTFWNEDANENLILDAGEDGTRIYYYGTFPPTTGHTDGLITPTNSAGGVVKSNNPLDSIGTVTTDANGVGGFTLTYPKQSGLWTIDRIQATTLVQGSETRSEIILRLPAATSDVSPCILGNSPYTF